MRPTQPPQQNPAVPPATVSISADLQRDRRFEVLLLRGADPDAKNNENLTPRAKIAHKATLAVYDELVAKVRPFHDRRKILLACMNDRDSFLSLLPRDVVAFVLGPLLSDGIQLNWAAIYGGGAATLRASREW